jgi:hypothetical protein
LFFFLEEEDFFFAPTGFASTSTTPMTQGSLPRTLQE